MKAGDVVTLLVDRDGYMIRTPCPYNEAAAREHLDAVGDPVIVGRLFIVTLVVSHVRPAAPEHDTLPSPPPTATPEPFAVPSGMLTETEYSKLLGGIE